MYGGHITDAWDRRTCNSYLAVLMNEQLFSGLELGPGFASPHPAELDYEGYLTYVEDKLPPGEIEISSLQLSLVAFLTVCPSVSMSVYVPQCLLFVRVCFTSMSELKIIDICLLILLSICDMHLDFKNFSAVPPHPPFFSLFKTLLSVTFFRFSYDVWAACQCGDRIPHQLDSFHI